MGINFIWIKKKKYYYHDSYNTWNEAYKVAQYYKKKNKSRYFILKGEVGNIFPREKYRLYLDRIRRLI